MGSIKDYMDQANAIVEYSKLAYSTRLVSAAGGNISARCGEDVLITGTNVSLRSMRPESLVLCDMAKNVIESPSGVRPSKELGLHIGVYKSRPEIRYVLHLHPTYSIIASLAGEKLHLYTESAKLKLKDVPVVPAGAPGSDDLAGKVVKTLSDAPNEIKAFLMEAHGVLVIGETMEDCFNQAELLEDSAKIAVFQSLMNSCVKR